MKKARFAFAFLFLLGATCFRLNAQDSLMMQPRSNKNIIRYNLSGALLMGFDKYIVFGYERVLKNNRSFSINFGTVALPKVGKGDVSTDSLKFNNDVKNSGFNVSADYRFYLKKENKFSAPRGVYIGPYFSYNHFHRENNWDFIKSGSSTKTAFTKFDLDIATMGVELGYQFILWKRMALDLIMIGPGYGYYRLTSEISTNLTEEEKQQIRDGIKEVITEKFAGLNYIMSNKKLDTEGSIKTWNIGYRYIVHIGYNF